MSSFYHRAILSSAYALLFALVRSVTHALLFAVVRPVTYALLFALVRSVAYASALARSAILSIPFVRYAGVIATPDSWHIQKTEHLRFQFVHLCSLQFTRLGRAVIVVDFGHSCSVSFSGK